MLAKIQSLCPLSLSYSCPTHIPTSMAPLTILSRYFIDFSYLFHGFATILAGIISDQLGTAHEAQMQS